MESIKLLDAEDNLAEILANHLSASSVIIANHQGKVYCFPKSNTYYTTLSQEALIRFLTVFISDFTVTISDQSELDLKYQALKAKPLTEFLWLVGLYGSHGNLLKKLNEDMFFQLIEWPDFAERHLKKLEYIRLAAFMTLYASRIEDIALATQIDRNTIVNFINASYLSNILKNSAKITNKFYFC